MDVGALRREYSQKGLTREDLSPDPFEQFEKWFQQACDAELLEPNAMVLSTVSAEGA
ncbi:pyridoxamine 5'-phosphate oxidase, partial [filamentous cyanobacterium CCP5]